MTGDFDPDREIPLPPFLSRPSDPSPRDDGRPLPPWSSGGHGIEPREDASHPEPAPSPWDAPDAGAVEPEWSETSEADWTDEEAPWKPAEAPEPEDAPWEAAEPSIGATGPARDVHDAEEDAHAAQAGLEPWAAAEPIDEEIEDEPWLLDSEEDVLELQAAEDTDEVVLEMSDAAGEVEAVLEMEDDLVVEIGPDDPWSAEPPGAGDDRTEEAAVAKPEPELDTAVAVHASGGAEDEAPATPLDDLVETAGRALGGATSWAEAPLATFPGEAGAWDAVATGGEEGPTTDAGGAKGAADGLERLATRLRQDGWDALKHRDDDPLTSAVAAFLSGFRAGRGDG